MSSNLCDIPETSKPNTLLKKPGKVGKSTSGVAMQRSVSSEAHVGGKQQTLQQKKKKYSWCCSGVDINESGGGGFSGGGGGRGSGISY